MLATQRRTDATEVADGRVDETPDLSKDRLRKARLRIDYYKKRAAEFDGETIDKRATLFKLHRATIVRLEQGQMEPSLGLAMHMAHVLGVTVEALWVRRGQAS